VEGKRDRERERGGGGEKAKGGYEESKYG